MLREAQTSRKPATTRAVPAPANGSRICTASWRPSCLTVMAKSINPRPFSPQLKAGELAVSGEAE
jgi:hypothetical protein